MSRKGKRGKYKLRALTTKQKDMFAFLHDYIARHEFPPSIREIGDHVGIASTSVVNYNLNKLEEHGLIARWRQVSRAIKLNMGRAYEMGLTDHKDVNTKMLSIPVLADIVASNPVNVGEVHTWQTASEWLPIPSSLVSDPRYLFALRVQGDSMNDANIQDNDLVIMAQITSDQARNGDMVAAWIEGDDEMTLKRYYKEGGNIRLQPSSSDPQYQPIIRPAAQVKVQGKVVGVWRAIR